MLNQTISLYLESNKRLVIPQLGAFIVKTPGVSVVFSELLKRDDGILRALLHAEGLSELEAAGEIDRFAFDIRLAIQQGEAFRIDRLGEMKPGANGTIAFEYNPTPAATAEPKAEVAQAILCQKNTPILPTGQEKVTIQPTVHGELDAAASAEQPPSSRTTELKVSPSAKLNPEPYVKGLRYGKPHKNTNAYTTINGRRRIDRFLLVAIAASLVALAVIAYVFMHSSRDEESATQTIEQPVMPAPDETATPQTQPAK